ncbi:DUF6381 family protein [Streptomyces sp. NPDC058157]|uniref:DUF6381 family protein n=1 Tax=Streptomyces sp. NPDC058157 TaxID=3346360 RepID=UPI0036E646D0
MSSDSPRSDERARQMREKAEQLELAASRSADADERQRLMDEVLRIRQELEDLHGPESATMDPM